MISDDDLKRQLLALCQKHGRTREQAARLLQAAARRLMRLSEETRRNPFERYARGLTGLRGRPRTPVKDLRLIQDVGALIDAQRAAGRRSTIPLCVKLLQKRAAEQVQAHPDDEQAAYYTNVSARRLEDRYHEARRRQSQDWEP
jgi:hypothetical protein